MTARTISSIRANGPTAMSPRIRAENRERERERELIFFADFSTCEYGGIGRGSRKHGDRVYGGSLAGWNASIFRKEAVSPPPSFPEGGGKTTRVQWRHDASVAQSNRNRTIHSRFRCSTRPFAFNLRFVFLPTHAQLFFSFFSLRFSKNDLEKSLSIFAAKIFPRSKQSRRNALFNSFHEQRIESVCTILRVPIKFRT